MQLPREVAQLRARIDLDHSRVLATEDKVAVDIRDVGLAVSEHHSGQHARIELDVRELVDEFRPQQFQQRGELVRPALMGRGCQQQHEIGRDTSELQSLMRISYAVFCLKKKKKKEQAGE